MYALTNCDLFTGTTVLYDQAVLIDGEKIADLVPADSVPPGVPIHDLEGMAVAPGFIDLQVNGGGDVLFNDAPTADCLRTIADAHLLSGTTDFLPTYITGDDGTMVRAIEAVRAAREDGLAGILGIHLEGPFLSPSKAGVHDGALMREMQEEDLRLIPSFSKGVVLLTIAPEVVPRALIQRLAEGGRLLSIGHSNAERQVALTAFSDGASCTTHLFNAMSALTSREPGVVGASLEHSSSWCSIIVDGHHVDFGAVRVAWQAKAARRMFLVTDAMPPVGGQGQEFRLGRYEVKVQDGRCQLEDGTLAGSALDMATAVRNCVQHVGIPKDEALRMASTYPAEFVGAADELGRIAPGFWANLVIIDNEINVHAVIRRGEFRHEA